MTRELVLVLALVTHAAAGSEPAVPVDSGDGGVNLEQYRTTFDRFLERDLGTASRAVRFDWRRSKVMLGLEGGELLEYNNFTTGRVGVFARIPMGPLWGELGADYVITQGTSATQQLSLTPYRQMGRPSRLEVNVNVGLPLAEGVVTPRAGFFSAAELVFSAVAGLRYRYYFGELKGANFGTVAKSVLAPQLSKQELTNLESQRLPGMQVDPTRYDLLAGLSLDVFLHTGIFFTPRVMLGIPVFSGFADNHVGVYWELSLSLGYAF